MVIAAVVGDVGGDDDNAGTRGSDPGGRTGLPELCEVERNKAATRSVIPVEPGNAWEQKIISTIC